MSASNSSGLFENAIVIERAPLGMQTQSVSFSCSAVSAKACSTFANRLRNPVSLPDTFPTPTSFLKSALNQIIADVQLWPSVYISINNS